MEAVLAHIQQRGPVLRADLLRRFARDDEAILHSVLLDLIESGLVAREGSHEATRLHTMQPEAAGEDASMAPARLDAMVRIALHRDGPLSVTGLLELVAVERDELAAALARLVADGLVSQQGSTPDMKYACETYEIPSRERASASRNARKQVIVAAAAAACRGRVSVNAADGGVAEAAVGMSDASVTTQIDWSTPIALVPPDPSILGDAATVLGTWRELNCDPTTPPGCLRLVIESSTSGFAASLHVDRTWDVLGPFAPVTSTDATRGYPREVDATQYATLQADLQPAVTYRLLNATFSGSTLSFDWSRYEPWNDWCALQTPYPWQVGDRTFYFCVPQSATAQASIDQDKVALCTSADFGELCDDGQGSRQPCACTQADSTRCAWAYCACSGQGCRLPAQLESGVVSFQIRAGTATLQFSEPFRLESTTLTKDIP